jgi:dienelactone hydrolase
MNRTRTGATFCALIFALAPLGVFSQETSQTHKAIVSMSNGDVPLSGYLYRPEGEGPFPTLLFNHGSAPGNTNDQAFDLIGPYFAERGWAVFAPYRRGQGLSSEAGPYIGDQIRAAQLASLRSSGLLVGIIALVLAVGVVFLTRRRKVWLRATPPVGAIGVVGAITLYFVSMNAGAAAMVESLSTDHVADHLTAYEWLRDQDFVDPNRIATGGNSFGGIVTIFAVQQVPYCAAFSASGGAQSWSRASALRQRMQEAVEETRAPLFLFQAANDYTIAPSEVLGALRPTTGQRIAHKIFPSYGSSEGQGHAFGWQGVSEWGADVIQFLATNCN